MLAATCTPHLDIGFSLLLSLDRSIDAQKQILLANLCVESDIVDRSTTRAAVPAYCAVLRRMNKDKFFFLSMTRLMLMVDG